MAIWSMNLLLADFIVKDSMSMVLLMHTGFGATSVSYHDDLMGPLGLLFVDIHHGYRNVSKMGANHYVDGYDVGC